MKTACKVKQRDMMDCAAACLASVSAYYRAFIPVSSFRQLAGTDKHGTNVLGIISAAEKIGLTAKAFRCQPDHLSKIPLPSIAHIVKDDFYHYVVLYKVTKLHLVIMDPADGNYHKQTWAEFSKIWTGVIIVLVPGANPTRYGSRESRISRFTRLIRPDRGMLIHATIAALMYTFLGLAPAIYLQKIFDHVLPDGNLRLLNLLTLLMFGILIFYLLFGYLKSLFTLRIGQSIDARLILGYYRHLLTLPLKFFDTMQVGEIISRVNDAVKIRTFINSTAVEVVLNLFTLCFSSLAMFLYFPKLALLVLLFLPPFLVLYIVNDRLNKRYQKAMMERASDIQTQFVESLNAIGTIKRFRLEEFAASKTESLFFRFLQTVYHSGCASVAVLISSEFLTRSITLTVLCAGSYFVIHQQLSTGELMSFYSLSGFFTLPLTALMHAGSNYQAACIASDRLFDIINLEAEQHPEHPVELDLSLSDDIKIEDIHFQIGNRTPVFQGLSAVIPKGQSTAIVGESGSGKSTLISLLQRLYPLQRGKIFINGYDIKYLSHASLRQMISVVPQQIEIFAGTIVENIAIGEEQPDLRKVLDLSRLLGLNEFVEKLPLHYYTILNEQGLNLSGGERQRIAIARALYRDPQLLILDEATSSLDAASESKVHEALHWFLGKGKTVVMIAHRLSTVRYCQKIIVLKDGELIEEGNHQQLIERNGYYAHMWQQSR